MGLPRLVIVGGGFGGLYAARGLKGAALEITLVDRSNHHLFQPLLYQVATAAISPGDIAQPIRRVLRKQKNLQTLLSEVKQVDLEDRRVILSRETITYDFLILATGATHAYFGHEEWEALAPGLKTLEDAVRIRRMFLTAFEEAELEEDPQKRDALLTFVIVGAGPTGVELAGTMSEVARHTLAGEFRRIDPHRARILLFEGGPRVLASYPEDLSASAERQLKRLGVEVRTHALVTRIERDGVFLGEERIAARNVFWAAGVSASPLGKSLGVPLDKAGRVKVRPDLSVEGHPEISVIGDLASLMDANGKPVPGVAPAAIQMGKYAARKVVAALEGKSIPPFSYRDKGSLATIGRAAAVAQLGRLHFSGLLAWLAWLFIHVYFLIGFRNRLSVLIQWAWAYIGFANSARLITYYEKEMRNEE